MRVLFLCTANSCRSQMAEALARSLGKGRIESYSAGSAPAPVHPLAVRVMADIGSDISSQESKPMAQFLDQKFDFVITVCDRVKESCPTWPEAEEHIHWSFDDPAEAGGTEESRVRVFRRVRDEISRRLQLFLLAHRVLGNESAGGNNPGRTP